MLKIEKSIRSLYPINLIEGEGLGTAYEYHVKLKKLQKFINSIDRPKRILIAGLPERYGLSLDFFLLAQILRADVVAVDERIEALDSSQRALETLRFNGLIDDLQARFSTVEKLAEMGNIGQKGESFDLALSSEVLHRLGAEGTIYLTNLRRLSKSIAVFVPNRGNEAHARISGLKGIFLEDLRGVCQSGNGGFRILKSGYLDMPPFPPGLSRSKEKRERASRSHFEALLMKGLEIYSRCENLLPTMIKRKRAHIVYVMGIRS